LNCAVSEKNCARGYNLIHSSACCFEDKIAYTFADIVSANFGRITQNKLSMPKSVYFGPSCLCLFLTLISEYRYLYRLSKKNKIRRKYPLDFYPHAESSLFLRGDEPHPFNRSSQCPDIFPSPCLSRSPLLYLQPPPVLFMRSSQRSIFFFPSAALPFLRSIPSCSVPNCFFLFPWRPSSCARPFSCFSLSARILPGPRSSHGAWLDFSSARLLPGTRHCARAPSSARVAPKLPAHAVVELPDTRAQLFLLPARLNHQPPSPRCPARPSVPARRALFHGCRGCCSGVFPAHDAPPVPRPTHWLSPSSRSTCSPDPLQAVAPSPCCAPLIRPCSDLPSRPVPWWPSIALALVHSLFNF
jgi:hypothetical protein